MKFRLLSAIVLGLVLGASAWAQDANSAPPAGQDSGMGAGGGYAQRGGRGGFGGMGAGRGVVGAVTDVAADHYTIKAFTGETYTVHFSANTRIFKQQAGMRGQGGGYGQGQGMGRGMGGNPPEQIKPTDIKVGDAIEVRGEIDASTNSVGAVAIVQLDPQRAQQMRDLQASFGKTWLMGKVTSIDGVKVTLTGPDNASYTFVANEDTDFHKRQDPIALTDIQVGDMVRVEGALKNGDFTAATVNVMGGMMPGGTPRVPRNSPPQ
jgi:hypothetical protein